MSLTYSNRKQKHRKRLRVFPTRMRNHWIKVGLCARCGRTKKPEFKYCKRCRKRTALRRVTYYRGLKAERKLDSGLTSQPLLNSQASTILDLGLNDNAS